MLKVKNHICLFLFLFSLSQFSFSQKNKVNNNFDGPYLLYSADSILIKSTERISKENFKSTSKAYPLAQKNKLFVEVKFSNDKSKNFKLRLKSKIEIEPSVWKQPSKTFIISDIEGEFDAFRNLLLANKIINEKYDWTFGDGHLVICGDLFDRGKDVPATLWLLYKLEEDAKLKGGYVHTILGNHDIMNLAENLKYLDKKYLQSAAAMGCEYVQLYDYNTELGRWLRSKNLIEKIGDNLFLHGGISPEVSKLNLSIEEMNKVSRPYIGWKNLKSTVDNKEVTTIFSSKIGLFWYRGYFKEPVLDELEVDKILRKFNAKKIIVGHTILEGNIKFYYHQKVLAVDVNQHKGDHQAVLNIGDNWYKLDLSGQQIKLN